MTDQNKKADISAKMPAWKIKTKISKAEIEENDKQTTNLLSIFQNSAKHSQLKH